MKLLRRDRLRRQDRVLLALAKSRAAARGDLAAALSELTEAAAQTLDVERVSVWLYTEDRSRIRCAELFERTPARHGAGAELAAADFPAYFRALEEERTLAAHDARADGRTREFTEVYLDPLGIGAMLDAPIRTQGRTIGVVCHEQVGPPRRWTLDEQAFAAAIADHAALALEAAERQRAEWELRDRVAELRQAKETAEEANEAKDRFLATLSHELRTPLTPVLAVASMLERDERLPGDVRNALTVLRRNVELEARLIDDLLDLTRISRGKLELDRRPADVGEILEHALETVEAELMTKRLRLVTDLEIGQHCFQGDAPRLTQVFWNLLHNAIKFTPAGGTIAVRSRLAGGRPGEAAGELMVEISDSGIGIDPEVLPRIFNAFEQADRRITRQFGGLGLGLAVSRALVELHGGMLTAASEGRDHGATFTLRLPVMETEAGALAVTPAEERTAEAAAAGHPLHLLLIEDHADTAAAMAGLLRGLGYGVTVAGCVAEALTVAQRAQSADGGLDLVVSDLGLPDGSGLDVMRELGTRYGLKGIALSGYGMEEDVRRSREAGFEKHLTKPVNLQTLDAAIRQVTGGV